MTANLLHDTATLQLFNTFVSNTMHNNDNVSGTNIKVKHLKCHPLVNNGIYSKVVDFIVHFENILMHLSNFFFLRMYAPNSKMYLRNQELHRLKLL